MVSGIRRVRKGVAHHVEGDRDQGQDDGREDQLVSEGRAHHNDTSFIDQVAQGRDADGQSQPDVGQEHLLADGKGDG